MHPTSRQKSHQRPKELVLARWVLLVEAWEAHERARQRSASTNRLRSANFHHGKQGGKDMIDALSEQSKLKGIPAIAQPKEQEQDDIPSDLEQDVLEAYYAVRMGIPEKARMDTEGR